uniref:Uncharacterized protein n=1 Tax=Lotharella globosa TaxID=91324 RepID=A0A6V3JH70_9EUKA
MKVADSYRMDEIPQKKLSRLAKRVGMNSLIHKTVVMEFACFLSPRPPLFANSLPSCCVSSSSFRSSWRVLVSYACQYLRYCAVSACIRTHGRGEASKRGGAVAGAASRSSGKDSKGRDEEDPKKGIRGSGGEEELEPMEEEEKHRDGQERIFERSVKGSSCAITESESLFFMLAIFYVLHILSSQWSYRHRELKIILHFVNPLQCTLTVYACVPR